VEAQTLVTGNVIEDAIEAGIALGWSWGAKALTAANNIVLGCGRGITFSVAEGAEAPMIVNNRIIGSRQEAIVAMNYLEPASGDLAMAGAETPQGAVISGNITG
jgi:nitrous oxidase accessory protein NosD